MRWKKPHVCHSIVGTLIALTALLSIDPKASQGAEKIRIFYTAITGEQSIFWIVKESGMLQKYGLEPEMIYLDTGTLAVQTMVAGESHLGMVGSTAVVLSALKGSGLKILSGLINSLTYILITDPNITRPEQLKGAKLAIARFGSLSDFGTRLALKKLGVPVSDVTLMQIGGGQTARFAALKSGVVQGAIVAPPMTRVAKEQGFYPMVDMIEQKIEYAGSGIAASPSLLRERPETIRNFMKGLVAGIHYAKTHKEESMRITARYMKLDYNKERPALEETYRVFIEQIVQRKPYPTLEGIQRVLDQIAETEPKVKGATPEQFIDTKYLKELDQSGFIDSLYR
ncbi:MAG: ABC transporter substrate-binding protein [Deltaproteobacteria bacterium]|nr:ABC transporter substrate-binding protein [Deltaproteobacteria bacterium]